MMFGGVVSDCEIDETPIYFRHIAGGIEHMDNLDRRLIDAARTMGAAQRGSSTSSGRPSPTSTTSPTRCRTAWPRGGNRRG